MSDHDDAHGTSLDDDFAATNTSVSATTNNNAGIHDSVSTPPAARLRRQSNTGVPTPSPQHSFDETDPTTVMLMPRIQPQKRCNWDGAMLTQEEFVKR